MSDNRNKLKQELKEKELTKSKIKRLPVGKQASFKFPVKHDNLKTKEINQRKVKIINTSDLRKLPTDPLKPFIGSLHLL